MLTSCSCTGVLQRGLWNYITVADHKGNLSLQLFSSSIVNTKKAELVWCAALGFSSIVHILIFQGLALDNAKPELKPRPKYPGKVKDKISYWKFHYTALL